MIQLLVAGLTVGSNSWLALIGATLCGFVLGLAFERLMLRPAARSGEIGWRSGAR